MTGAGKKWVWCAAALLWGGILSAQAGPAEVFKGRGSFLLGQVFQVGPMQLSVVCSHGAFDGSNVGFTFKVENPTQAFVPLNPLDLVIVDAYGQQLSLDRPFPQDRVAPGAYVKMDHAVLCRLPARFYFANVLIAEVTNW
jgi:hypothetical protein